MGPQKGGESGKISRFFSLSRHSFHSFLPLLGVFSWNFGICGSAGALKCARLEFSGCRVKPRRPQSKNCACPGVVLDIREGQPRLPFRLTFFGPQESREAHNKSLSDMEDLKKFQSSIRGPGASHNSPRTPNVHI